MRALCILAGLMLASLLLPAQNKIRGYEYWFNNAYGSKVRQTLTGSPVLSLDTQIPTDPLIPGLHSLHYRFFDDSSRFSLTQSHFFYKLPPALAASNLVACQYWFDQDLAGSTTLPVSSQAVVELNTLFNSSSLIPGLHQLHIRFKDNHGAWSLPYSSHFYRMPQQSVTGHHIVQVHYWFDDNLAAGVMESVAAQQVAEVNIAADGASLPAGLHWLHLRFRDDAGFWSGTNSQAFYKPAAEAVTNNLITGYRYWINENLEQQTTVTLAEPVNPLEAPLQANLSALEAGKYAIRFQFKDAKGQWSIVTTDSVTLKAFSAYTFTGNGNWSNPANWSGPVPPSTVPDGREVVIDHAEGGECVIDVPITMAPGSRLTVKPGKRLRIQGNLIHQ